MKNKVIIGAVYQHYRTKDDYIVLGLGKDEDTLVEKVAYRKVDATDSELWFREKSNFLDDVIDGSGKTVKRFILQGILS